MTTDRSTDRRTNTGQASSLWVPASYRTAPTADTATPEPVSDEKAPDRPRRQRTPRPWATWPANVRAAVAGTIGVLSACWAVSFDAIVAGAQSASIPFPFTWLCPLIVDGEMAIGTLVLVSIARTVKRRTRVYLGVLILASVAVSMAANMAGPFTRTHPNALPAPWSYIAAGVPSLWIALIVHQLVILWRHVQRPVDTAARTEPEPVAADVRADTAPTPKTTPAAMFSYYGVRSLDGRWWWDGGQWHPVHPPAVVDDVRPDTLPPSEKGPNTEPADAADAPSLQRPGGADDRPPSDAVAARRARIVDYLRQQADAGRDPAMVGVSELKRATGIPRPSLYRLLPDILSTFRHKPAMSGLEAA